MAKTQFHKLLVDITAQLAGRPLNEELQQWLNTQHGVGTPLYEGLKQACMAGVAEQWLCQREHGGIKYGRVYQPSAELANFSVDVVDMKDIVGPHHMHPQGEIDLIMPLTDVAEFDGHPAGWCVYPPQSAHYPTVSKGHALILYLLPKGEIQFTQT